MQIPGTKLLQWVTCREALEHLPCEELGRPVRLRWREGGAHRPSEGDRPAKTITGNTHGDGTVIASSKHPHSDADAPARTVVAGDGGGSRRALRVSQGQRIGDHSALSSTMTARPARVGAGAAHVLSWPWDVPSTTVTCDSRIPPPGHHPDGGSILSQPNAIVLSERAAALLQGFPSSWTFCGATKRARWSQIGMAMPPPLAYAVARSIVEQLGAERRAG